MKYQLVEIRWIDSESFVGRVWHDPKSFIEEQKGSKRHMVSIGYLFHQDRNWYYLSASMEADDDGNWIRVGNAFSIPKGSVKNIKRIKKLV